MWLENEFESDLPELGQEVKLKITSTEVHNGLLQVTGEIVKDSSKVYV